ncbi:hypothetical protein [Cytobacillus oceanisediminis]|uniref:hypothetical protein n=1 Tax=Cytobacillus oceanisediminis TaxID=665099 RepID=UPI002079BFD6|nr:hypothetical protein [Cytobacillus oceanisediminis]
MIACTACNLSKNDKLATDVFLETLIDRNGNFLTMPELKIREDMMVYTSKKLKDLYEYSIDNGYTDIWVPRKKLAGD